MSPLPLEIRNLRELLDGRFVRRGDGTRLARQSRVNPQGFEVHFFEESVVFYILGATFEVAEALGEVRHQEVLHETLRALGEIPRELDLALEDFLVNLHRVFRVEGVDAWS